MPTLIQNIEMAAKSTMKGVSLTQFNKLRDGIVAAENKIEQLEEELEYHIIEELGPKITAKINADAAVNALIKRGEILAGGADIAGSLAVGYDYTLRKGATREDLLKALNKIPGVKAINVRKKGARVPSKYIDLIIS